MYWAKKYDREKIKWGRETESVLSDGGISVITPSWKASKDEADVGRKEESNRIFEKRVLPLDCRFIRCNGNVLFSCFIGGILSTNFSDSSDLLQISTFGSDITLLRLQGNYYCVCSRKRSIIRKIFPHILYFHDFPYTYD